jgi:hypothetical protein
MNLCIGRDYRGTLSGVTVDGVASDDTASVTWTLYSAAGDVLATGSAAFVSAGIYTFVIDQASFAGQSAGAGYGRLAVAFGQGGADGAWEASIYFARPGTTS